MIHQDYSTSVTRNEFRTAPVQKLIWPVREIKTNIIFINHLASCDYSYYSDCIIQTCAGFLSLLSFAQTCKSSTSYFNNSRDKLMIITRTDWKYRTSAQSPERMSTFIPNKTHTKVNKSTQSSEIWDKDMYQCMSVLNTKNDENSWRLCSVHTISVERTVINTEKPSQNHYIHDN